MQARQSMLTGVRQRLAFAPGMLRLALPISLQLLMTTALNLADTFMVGQLGAVQIGAIALGNQIFFLLLLFQLGVGSGGAMFASQYWGAGDIAGVQRSLGLSLLLGTLGAAVFSAAAIAAPGVLLSVFTTDAAVIAQGSSYLRIVGTSYVVTAISLGYTQALRSVGNAQLPMIASALSITLNIVGNYVLIFGKLGLPALGVAGAALSTAIARVIELSIILRGVYRRPGPIAAGLRQLTDWSARFVRKFLLRTAPVVANEVLWSTGFTMYTVVFGRMGTEYLAAYNISDTVGRLLLVIFISTAHASAVTLGNRIGAARIHEAAQIGRTLLYLVPIAAALVGVLGFFVIAPTVPALFEVSTAARILVRQFLQLFAILMLAKTINMHVIVGILRSGGDTQYSLLIDVLPLWLIGVPLAMVGGLVLGLPAPIVYIALGIEESVRLVLGWRRVRSGRWIHDLTDREPAQARVQESLAER